VGSPDQGADSRAQLAHPLGQLVEINTNNGNRRNMGCTQFVQHTIYLTIEG
jgi:hypothetical protein